MHQEHSTSPGDNRQRTISRWVWIGFAAIAAYFLITEHRAHLFGVLPFLLLAACPLLHLFHHRGHGADSGKESGPRTGSPPGNGPDAHGQRHMK